MTVTELGAGLRSYRVGDVEFLDGYPPDGCPTASSYGQVLAPLPNRIDRGTYTFEGTEQTLPWNETDKQNAIHGLTRWMNWEPARVHSDAVSMRLVLHAQPGYPFTVELQHDFLLGDDGLTVTHSMRNAGASAVPYGVGSAGPTSIFVIRVRSGAPCSTPGSRDCTEESTAARPSACRRPGGGQSP